MGLTYALIDEATAWREKVNTISHKKKEGQIVVSVRSEEWVKGIQNM